jgi:hypothetical protein
MSIDIQNDIHQTGQLEVLSNGESLIQYNHVPPEWGHPHFHPVRTPAGHLITNLAPYDHVWHCGLWFSWKSINGVNVWEQPSFPDGESVIKPTSASEVTADNDDVSFSASYHWQKRDGSQDLLDGEVDVVIHAPDGDAYSIDLSYSFRGCGGDTSFERVPYDAEKCDWGGYAGLSFRPVRDFVTPVVTNSDGETEDIRWKKTRWLDMSNQIDGLRDTWVGLCLMDHTGNLRHPVPANFHEPHWWHLRWTQLSLLYEDDYVLPEGESLDLRYRVVIHDGKAEPDRLNSIWDAWTRAAQ